MERDGGREGQGVGVVSQVKDVFCNSVYMDNGMYIIIEIL